MHDRQGDEHWLGCLIDTWRGDCKGEVAAELCAGGLGSLPSGRLLQGYELIRVNWG